MVKTVLSMIGSILCLSACQVGVNPPSYVRPWTPAVAAIALPTAMESAPVPVPTAWPRYIASPPKASALPELAPSPGVSADEGQAVTGPAVVCCASTVASGASGGSGGSATSDGFFISDVVLAETGESVMGEGAPAAIQADHTRDEPFRLIIKGKFKGLSVFSIGSSRFSYEAGLRYQSYEGKEPALRVLLDQSLILEVVSFSDTRLEVLLPQRDVTELYLQGLHDLTVYAENKKAQATLWVGEPTNQTPTFPQITSVEPIELNGQSGLLITGYFFLLNPDWQSVEIGEKKLAVQRIDTLSNGISLLWASLPETLLPGVFLLRYTSPMGVTQFSLEVS